MSSEIISGVDFCVLRISARTLWTFLEIHTESGLTGTGEATLNGRERALASTAARWRSSWVGQRITPELTSGTTRCTTLVEAAVASAFDQALWDILGQTRGQSLADALGGMRREEIRLYANINRRTVDRSPGGFAQSASAALANGYDAIKIAPFDEINPSVPALELGPVLDLGLSRIAAVRDAIGPARDLMVDCHWRFAEETAATMIGAVAQFGLFWVECPLPETTENLSALRRLRGLAHGQGMQLAGCEEGVLATSFLPFLNAGAYDVMMPDVKYIGGLEEMLRVADLLAERSVGFSPHNPSGPICHAASLHVSAASQRLDRLEIQFDESPLFLALGRHLPPPRYGSSPIPNARRGLGIKLDPDLKKSLSVAVEHEAQIT